jgi:hypothetical protein
MPEYTLTQLRELRRLALELGFMDDVRHWDGLIALTLRDHTDGSTDA